MMGQGLCNMCKHFESGYESESGRDRCPAFPDGIPQELLAGAATHFEYLEGQTGERIFEPAEWVEQDDLDAAIDNLDLIRSVGMIDNFPE